MPSSKPKAENPAADLHNQLSSPGASPVETALNALKVGVSIIDPEFRIVFINDQMKTLGWDREAILGHQCFRVYNERDSICPACPAAETFRAGEQQVVVQRGRNQRYYEVLTNPVFDDEGKVGFVIELTRDVTDREQLEQRIQSLYRAADRLLDLNPEDVARKNHDERVVMIRDRVSETLQSVLLYDNFIIDLLEPRTGKLIPLIVQGYDEKYLRTLHRKAEISGSGITGHVAATGRPYLCPDTRKDPLFISGIAQACSSITVPLTSCETILGTLNIESRIPNAFGRRDLTYLEILAHFVAIALNLTDLLKIEEMMSVRRVAESLADKINNYLMAIVNNVYLLQQEFVQSSEYVGRLATVDGMVDKIVEALEKTVKIDRMSIRHPEVIPEDEILGPRYDGKSALIAEDESLIRYALAKILAKWGFSVDQAQDGVEAIDLISAKTYDIIISDVQMPRKTGLDVLEHARSVQPDTPIIFVTGGYDATHAVIHGQELNLEAVLYKPFKVTALRNEIDRLLARAPSL